MDEKIYDLITKMYSEMNEKFEKLETKIDKIGIVQEKMQQDLDTLEEVQRSHMEENQRHHTEIVEMLSARIDNTDGAVRKISAVK